MWQPAKWEYKEFVHNFQNKSIPTEVLQKLFILSEMLISFQKKVVSHGPKKFPNYVWDTISFILISLPEDFLINAMNIGEKNLIGEVYDSLNSLKRRIWLSFGEISNNQDMVSV